MYKRQGEGGGEGWRGKRADARWRRRKKKSLRGERKDKQSENGRCVCVVEERWRERLERVREETAAARREEFEGEREEGKERKIARGRRRILFYKVPTRPPCAALFF